MILRYGCSALRDAGLKMAMEKRFDTVVIGGSWNRLFTDDENMDYFEVGPGKIYMGTAAGRKIAFEHLARQITRFRAAGKRVFLVLDGAIAPDFSPRGLKARLSLSASNFTPNRFVSIRPAQVELHAQMLALAQRTGATAIDPLLAYCEADKCRATNEHGLPIYKDAGHFNPDWVISYGKFIDATVTN